MKGSFSIGRVLGIPIQLHVSWFLIAILITWSLAVGYFPQEYPALSGATVWVVAAVTAILFFASVLIHELGHSIVALREKVPVKSITLFVFGGVAAIGREPPTAGSEFRIAIAGPLSSLGLAALFGGLGAVSAGSTAIAAPLAYLARINLILALFNMIPGFPLDGGRVLRAALWAWRGNFRNATLWASRAGRVVAFGFILYGFAQILLGGGLFNGLWIAFIGWFLNSAAESNFQQVVLREALEGVQARNVMTQQCQLVPGSMKLDQLIDEQVFGAGQRCFFVADEGTLQGLVTLHNIRAVPREERDDLTAAQVMTSVNSVFRVHPDDDVWMVLQRMDEANVNQVPVTDNGHLLGLITRESLLHDIRLRADLSV